MLHWFKAKSESPNNPARHPNPRSGETIQYLVARQDLDMSPGKMSAQCAHASSSIALAHYGAERRLQHRDQLPKHAEAMERWLQSSFAKVVLRAKTRQQLLKLCDQLDELQIPYAPIFDACRTELEPEEANGSTLTCIGITPLYRDEVPKCLQKCQVFK